MKKIINFPIRNEDMIRLPSTTPLSDLIVAVLNREIMLEIDEDVVFSESVITDNIGLRLDENDLYPVFNQIISTPCICINTISGMETDHPKCDSQIIRLNNKRIYEEQLNGLPRDYRYKFCEIIADFTQHKIFYISNGKKVKDFSPCVVGDVLEKYNIFIVDR